MNFNNKYDFILKVPIEKLDISWDSIKKLLKLNLKYFEKYNCYNLDDKIKREFILLKSYK
jgi:hypothetical protein